MISRDRGTCSNCEAHEVIVACFEEDGYRRARLLRLCAMCLEIGVLVVRSGTKQAVKTDPPDDT